MRKAPLMSSEGARKFSTNYYEKGREKRGLYSSNATAGGRRLQRRLRLSYIRTQCGDGRFRTTSMNEFLLIEETTDSCSLVKNLTFSRSEASRHLETVSFKHTIVFQCHDCSSFKHKLTKVFDNLNLLSILL